MDWSSKVYFRQFCDFLEHLVKAKTKPKKLSLLKKFLESLRKELPPSSEGGETCSLFPLLRLLLPQLDKERGVFNIKVFVVFFLPCGTRLLFICLAWSIPDLVSGVFSL